jgi:hypothetical protein
VPGKKACILTTSTQQKHGKLEHVLFVDEEEVPLGEEGDRNSEVAWLG